MKIAIVSPSPVPFTMGGIENMMLGLFQTINQETSHQADLIKLPTKEHSFWELIESYYQFYKLDLSHFDVVIAAKYPAWMVQHNNCIFYVAHRLRGLYDTYHMMNLPWEVERGNKKIDQILDYMEQNTLPDSLDNFFAMLFDLKQTAGLEEQAFFQFPGPFIRKLIHYMDNYAFTQRSAARYCSISKTVRDRKEYFPEGAEVEVIYLPSAKKEYSDGEYKHVFMVSRLDAPKRIDMLIRAMKYVKSNVKLYIAGMGPEKEKLEKLAKGDSRIEFLGFVSDEELEDYYANSLVVPYFPYEEDYGLITVEAMMHKKPVITTFDAGGPSEFVHDYETGFVTEFDAKKIAEKIEFFAQNPDEAKRMGENAYKEVKDITWKSLCEQLLDDKFLKHEMKRPKIVVTSTFPIYPPMGGGQARIYNLYRELAKSADVEIISYTNFDQPKYDEYIARNLREIRIPRDINHSRKMWKMEEKALTVLSDIGEITLGGETPEYRAAFEESLKKSDLCVVSHPYLYPLVKEYIGDKPFVYEAHNVESIMKEKMLPESEIKAKLVRQVFDTEKECCNKSVFVMTCSEEDRQKLNEIYGTPLEKIIVVPNGVNTQATLFVTPEQRKENKAKLGLQYETVGLFMGSWHGPNLDACEMIFEIAKKCPETKFMLMGSQCAYFKDRRDIPENVGMLGLVSEEAKNRIFSCVDFALNPMLGGSGTNLKMFDYMSAGIPIISTEFGTRGIENKDLFILADTVDEMAAAVNRFAVNGMEAEKVGQARAYVKQTFDWSVISDILSQRIKETSL